MVMAQPWWPLSPWLSPGAAWFIFFNAVVAAIAVMSSSARQDKDTHAPSSARMRLRRSASSAVLDHLRSFSLFSVHPVAGGVTVPPLDDLFVGVPDSGYCHCSQEAEVPLPAPLVTDQVSAAVVAEAPRPTAPVAGGSARTAERSAASSAPATAAAADAEPASAPESKEEEKADAEEGKSISLDEAYAMVQQQSPPAPAAASICIAATTTTHTAASWPQTTRSDLAAKKASKRRRRPGRREAEEAPAELNARAELFIRQFREDLKLQRINSLLRHTHALGPVDGTPTPVAVA